MTIFKLFWTFKSRKRTAGRPSLDPEIRELIQDMARANPLWGAPRIHGELMKLGIDVHERTVSKVIKRFRPTAGWAAQQIVEACPWDSLPKYLLRDRDGIYGEYFQSRVQNMGINVVKTAPQSPWQNPYVERLIGSIRRDCINAMIILNEAHLKHILTEYFEYYHKDRTHLGLSKETPAGRPVSEKKGTAKVVALPLLGGLHHRYEWQDAA